MRKFAVVLLFCFALVVASSAQTRKNDGESRRNNLNKLLAEHWEWVLSNNPEFASVLGDRRWNDQVSDLSLEAVPKELAATRAFLQRFEALDVTGLSEQEVLNKTLMVRGLRNDLEDAKFENYLMPVNQMSGIHLQAAQLPALWPFKTVKDYDDYIARLNQFPRALEQTSIRMRTGMGKGLMPPKFLLEKVAVQAEGIANQAGEASPFALPLKRFPKEFTDADKQRLSAAILKAIDEKVRPAYSRFAAFVKDEYAPKGRTEYGVWSLPDGAARYALRARRSTTTEKTPEEIHQLGLSEVARIEKEMMQIATKLGRSDLKSFNAAMKKDPKLFPKTREEILERYRQYIAQMETKLPQLFGRLPKAKLVVEPVESFREKEAAGAQYNRPAPDGSRPGRVLVNTYKPEEREFITMESTAYHEGHPGHHLQLAIQQELEALPPFRQQGGYGAFVEGWALYSERLGKEVGFYQDPYNDYGRLQDEMLRAIRLVLDTGVHYKKWSRDQMVQFFRDHSSSPEVDIQAETDRYISWPGQALSYKIGQLKILELREKAKKELGAKFDIRAFHDEVLGAGALPLDVLEARIYAWIAKTKKG